MWHVPSTISFAIGYNIGLKYNIMMPKNAHCSQEIKRLEEENMKLKDWLASVQTKATSALSEKDKLKNDLLVATASSATSRDSAVSMDGSASSEELASLQARIEELQTQLSEVMVVYYSLY